MEEIFYVMKSYESMDWWKVYRLAVPVRKWLIRRNNKFTAEQNRKDGQPPPNEPLAPGERIKMIQSAQQSPSKPQNIPDLMGAMRNRK